MRKNLHRIAKKMQKSCVRFVKNIDYFSLYQSLIEETKLKW